MGQAVTIAVIDDQDVVLTGIKTWVAEDPQRRVEIVHTGTALADLDDGAAAKADVLVVDLRIDGELVFDKIAELTEQGRRIVVFSQHTEPAVIHRAEMAGARAYITKESNEGRGHLIEAILAVAAGGRYTTPSQAGAMLAASGTCNGKPRFSDQELRTMRLWLGGLTRAGVARQMGISEHTVKQYLERAREKYAKAGRKVPTRLDLYREARRDGIVTD
ncbi:response regulator transcription factor [Actinomadura rubrisoli]|uniref:Response regulator transcription factor n=1 Tax=Actinomadura rubrisoli TaxID=2530368 RepID=A0A4V2YYB5_9ACTN|nr:response regulator transcription factor [Actinomadura rubrisoli]TDD92487.1 response regulator transcription factor [Actinomadura rubrisoli]